MSDSLSEANSLPCVETVRDTVNPPYTPTQRTRLVSDILNLAQERRQLSEQKWNELRERTTSLTDNELDMRWEETVGEWLLTRSDIPRFDHDDVAALVNSGLAAFTGEGVVSTAQKFKRLSASHSADYGYLAAVEYSHSTDTHSSNQIVVEVNSQAKIVQIKAPGGLKGREMRMLMQRLENQRERLEAIAKEEPGSRRLTLSAITLFSPEWEEASR